MPTPLPRRDRAGASIASSPLGGGLPRNTAGSAPAIWSFEACSAFTHVSAYLLAESPKAIRYIKGFDGFVTSSVAPTASGWSDPSPGGICTHWKPPAFTAHNILTLRDAFDALNILPTTPIILDEEIRLYYGGCNESVGRDGKKRWRSLPGLAILRRDGFTSLRVRDKKKPGTLQTTPFDLPHSRTLYVNVNCPHGATLRAELADAATGKPIPGFAIADSLPLQGDHVRALVTWKLHNTLSDKTIASAVENVVLTFEIQDAHGEAKLYSFWFDEK